MLEQQLVSHQVDGISFSLYSAEEIRSLSVMQVTNPNVFDVLGHPASGGLYDPALGKCCLFNPWTADTNYIRFLQFLLAYFISVFKQV